MTVHAIGLIDCQLTEGIGDKWSVIYKENVWLKPLLKMFAQHQTMSNVFSQRVI